MTFEEIAISLLVDLGPARATVAISRLNTLWNDFWGGESAIAGMTRGELWGDGDDVDREMLTEELTQLLRAEGVVG